ncbi:MAG: OmpW family outer membrane protein [Pseudomonadota bacterium]|nr:outer membrane beta-barrel protein [Pseudomonadota bacterium]
MNKPVRIALAAVIAATTLLSVAAQADESPFVVRLRALHIGPANKSDAIAVPSLAGEAPALNLPADAIEVSSKWIPDIDLEYFFTPNWSAELVLTIPQKHDVAVVIPNVGKATIGSFKHLPPTLTAKYNFNPTGTVRPYVGVGVNLTLIMSVDITVPAALSPTGADLPLQLDNHSIGAAAQAGVDIKLADHWFANIDAKYVQLKTDVKAGTLKVSTAKVDPWLLGAGVAYRF